MLAHCILRADDQWLTSDVIRNATHQMKIPILCEAHRGLRLLQSAHASARRSRQNEQSCRRHATAHHSPVSLLVPRERAGCVLQISCSYFVLTLRSRMLFQPSAARMNMKLRGYEVDGSHESELSAHPRLASHHHHLPVSSALNQQSSALST